MAPIFTGSKFGFGRSAAITTAARTADMMPILVTDSTGTTATGGVNTDSFASSLQFAIPGATSSGLNLTDQNPTGRVSALRNLTNGGSLSADTSIYKYYGGSLSVPHSATGTYSNDVWSSIGSGPYTVEMWVYLVDSTMNSGYGYNVLVGRNSYDGIINIGMCWAGHNGTPSLAVPVRPSSGSYVTHYITDDGTQNSFPVGQWVHCAQTRDSSGTVRTFKNGIKVAETSGITGSLSINYSEFGGWTTGFADATEFKVSDMRVYNAAKYTGSSFTLF